MAFISSSENTEKTSKKEISSRNYTKICNIRQCENNLGKSGKSDVKMFRMPTDVNEHKIWSEAISSYSISRSSGFICIKHFRESDLKFGKKTITLKKGAFPQIFDSNYTEESICETHSAQGAENTSKRSNENGENQQISELYDTLKVEHANLRKEFIELETKRCLEVKELRNEINKLTQSAKGAGNPENTSNASNRSNENGEIQHISELYDTLKVENANLRKEFIELETKRCLEVEKLGNEFKKSKMNTEIKKQQIKHLSGKVYRQEKSIQSLKNLLKDLEAQSILTAEAYEALEKIDQNEVLKCITHGQPMLTKYPPEVRKFCFTLNYHSPAAYRIVRDQFDKSLPHPQTLIKWLQQSDLNGEHGITEGTMKRLAGFVKNLKDSTGEQLICTLMLDEMYIKKQVYWDQNKFEYAGYPTYENSETGCKKQNKCAKIANKTESQAHKGESSTSSTKRITRTSAATAQNSNQSVNVMENDNRNGADELIRKEIQTDTENVETKKNKSPLATRALVFMLSGINKSFEFPVGYHFVNGLGGKGLCELVTEVIMKVSECGVKVCNMTFDGAKDNIKMCEYLGANLDPLSDNFKPFISSPYDESIIYLIFDPSHMEKLLRNLLGNHKILFDENDNKINWSYFIALQEISKEGNMLTHKLTKKHTKEFQRNKMNVRLAAETFSTSVADSFKMLRVQRHPDFVNSNATEKFTRMADKMFDILNSRDTRHTNAYKRPLNFENKREIFEFIEQSMVSLKGLKMNQVRKHKGVEKTVKISVLQTINKTPVVGFLVNLTNLPQMYAQYVEKDENYPSLQKMNHFRTYAMSQDRIELFFGKIRARNGSNNNPNCAQFKGAYRRLLANIEIKPPADSNCMMFDAIDLHSFTPQSNIYVVSSMSSRRPKIDIQNDDTFKNNLKRFEEEREHLEALNDLAGMEETNYLLEGMADTSIAYASKLIEESILAGNFHCDCCKNVFTENEKLNDRSICLIPSKTPCISTYYICRVVDKYFKTYKPNKRSNINDVDFKVIYYKIFQDIDYDNIFVKTNFKNHEQHRFYLVKMVVQNYLYIKTAQISKDITYDEYDKIIRSKLTKWIHFAGQ